MNSPAISILLPFFNAEQTLSRAIDSILNQSYSNFELILIDNNSGDKSLEIAKDYCGKDKRCSCIIELKPGIVAALNTGLAIARGTYIARMDADDWSYPDRLQNQYEILEENSDYGVVAGLVQYISHRKKTEGFERYVKWSNQIRICHDFTNKQFIESPVIHPSVMWRKAVSEKFGGYKDGNFPEDYELWLRWLSNGVKFYKLDRKVIKWYDSDIRLTRTDSRYSDQSFFEIKSRYLTSWLQKNNPFHPNVLVWGASKISRKRINHLKDFGIVVTGYVDITKKRQLEQEVIYYEDIPSPNNVFVLVYLKEETMRANTVAFLESRGFVEGKSFLLVS